MTATAFPELAAAADLIEERGWCQGQDETPQGISADGALRLVMGAKSASEAMPKRAWSRAWEIRERLRPFTGGTSRSRNPLANWNDAPGRTLEEVLSMLRTAAEA